MASSIHIRCAACNARIKAPAQLIGQTRPCPKCSRSLTVQMPIPEDAGPLLFHIDMTTSSKQGAAAEKQLILLVDDDRALSDGLRSLLEKRGHRVIQAYDGVQAKEMVHEQRPNLMILDMMMPRLGGYPVLEYLNKSPEAPPVIMITANENRQHKAIAESLGVVDYLHKPFPMERLLKSVEKNLER
jgi:CheY-like chemotaxis protein